MRKHSKQREAIQFYLATHSNHPTAETVYLGIKEEFPNVSLGTVYRNLALLAENGEILKISTGVGPDRFDGCIDPHYHFFCTECGAVYDLKMESIDHINDHCNHNFEALLKVTLRISLENARNVPKNSIQKVVDICLAFCYIKISNNYYY